MCTDQWQLPRAHWRPRCPRHGTQTDSRVERAGPSAAQKQRPVVLSFCICCAAWLGVFAFGLRRNACLPAARCVVSELDLHLTTIPQVGFRRQTQTTSPSHCTGTATAPHERFDWQRQSRHTRCCEPTRHGGSGHTQLIISRASFIIVIVGGGWPIARSLAFVISAADFDAHSMHTQCPSITAHGNKNPMEWEGVRPAGSSNRASQSDNLIQPRSNPSGLTCPGAIS